MHPAVCCASMRYEKQTGTNAPAMGAQTVPYTLQLNMLPACLASNYLQRYHLASVAGSVCKFVFVHMSVSMCV